MYVCECARERERMCVLVCTYFLHKGINDDKVNIYLLYMRVCKMAELTENETAATIENLPSRGRMRRRKGFQYTPSILSRHSYLCKFLTCIDEPPKALLKVKLSQVFLLAVFVSIYWSKTLGENLYSTENSIWEYRKFTVWVARVIVCVCVVCYRCHEI